ncbi:uncharacterized protein LOC117591320 isoform X2 [Drosophila guanche]|uniref:Uncharacterized protein n=1 Tax=Drosophila guanche TaxID=7266 RepID=A0A3B0IYY7_DROGU|nr:uncharacterized protein LOC117591320 isoform X2 [Drosophila guanche]SPP73255.1 Hypothetical predicted protein [Drosophila guanche]
MSPFIVVIASLLMVLALPIPVDNFTSYLKDFQRLEQVQTPEGNSQKINEPKHSQIFHINPLENPLMIYLKRMQQSIEQKLPQNAASKPKQMDMSQSVVSYERNNTTQNDPTVGGSRAPKLSYVRLMRVLMEHIWITAAEAAAAKGIPTLTNTTR